MYGWRDGMGAGEWTVMILILIVLIGLALVVINRLAPPRTRGSAETPVEILDRRLASGEIDVDEYRRLKDELQSTGRR